MPELGFVLSASEETNVLKLVFDQGGWLVPDLNYTIPQYVTIGSYETYLDYRKQTRLFFILHPSYLKSPLDLHSIEKDGRTVYFIMQRNGGPTIDFLSCVEYKEKGKAYISTGSLSHYPTY